MGRRGALAAWHGRTRTLAGALIALAAAYPLLEFAFLGLSVWTLASWAVLLGALYAVGIGRYTRRHVRFLAAVAIVAGATGLGCYNLRDSGHDWIFTLFDGLTLLFLLLVTGRILVDVVFRAAVDADHLVGAACAYVLIGLTFAYVLSVLSGLTAAPSLSTQIAGDPGAATDPAMERAGYLYFSFVTLSTLGYGDISPLTLTSRLVAGVEAMIGQLFLTILVARLVGLHLTRKAQGDSTP